MGRSSKSPPSWQFVTWFLRQNTFQLYTDCIVFSQNITLYMCISYIYITGHMQYTCKLFIYLTSGVFSDGLENNRQTGNPGFHAPFLLRYNMRNFPHVYKQMPMFSEQEGWRDDGLVVNCLGLCFGQHIFFAKTTHTHTQTGYQMIVDLDDHWISFVNTKPNCSTAWNLDWISLQILNSGSTAIDIDISSLIPREGHSVSCWKNR